MKAILVYIATYMSSVFKTYGVRLVDSEASHAFGENAYVDLSAEHINIRIINDRGQLFMDFQSKLDSKKKDSWYSVDLVRSLISGETLTSAVLDEEYGKFLQDRFEDICKLFSDENVDETIKSLKNLRKERAKRMFK